MALLRAETRGFGSPPQNREEEHGQTQQQTFHAVDSDEPLNKSTAVAAAYGTLTIEIRNAVEAYLCNVTTCRGRRRGWRRSKACQMRTSWMSFSWTMKARRRRVFEQQENTDQVSFGFFFVP